MKTTHSDFPLDENLILKSGEVSEITSYYSNGDSTVPALAKAIINVQAEDGSVLYLDFLNSINPVVMRDHGVDFNKIYIIDPSAGTESHKSILAFIKKVLPANVEVTAIVIKSTSSLFEHEFAAKGSSPSEVITELEEIVKDSNVSIVLITSIPVE